MVADFIVDYIYGLGGRDITVKEIEQVCKEANKISKTGFVENYVKYFGVR